MTTPPDTDRPVRGVLPLPENDDDRHAALCALAGLLAESSITAFTITDPRACRSWTIAARQTDLPSLLMSAAPGTTLTAEPIALCVEPTQIAYAATPALAAAIAQRTN